MSKKKSSPRIREGKPDDTFRFDDVNQRFTSLRLERQESQEDWGQNFNLTRTSISSIELNRQAVPIYVMQVLRRKFKVDLNWFICGDEPKGTASADIKILEKELDAEQKAHAETRKSLEECRANLRALRIAFGVD